MLLARRLVNGRERGCLQVVSCSVLRLVNMSTRAMRLKTQVRALACLQVVYPALSVVKEQSLSASLVRLEKELFPLYLKEKGKKNTHTSRARGGVFTTPTLEECRAYAAKMRLAMRNLARRASGSSRLP